MKEAIISGATGFIGRNLVKELLNNQYRVTVLVRPMSEIPKDWIMQEKVRIIKVNSNFTAISNEKAVGEEAVFFHFAWGGVSGGERNGVSLQLLNIKNTCDAVILAKRMNCTRFINAGSIFEYKMIKMFETEEDNVAGNSIYSVAKLSADGMARIVAQENEIEYINLIISNIYGVGEKSERFIVSIVKKMLKNEEILLSEGKQLEDFIYILDAVRAMVLVAERGRKNSSYYIGSSCQRPLRDFVTEMHNILKSRSDLQFGKKQDTGITLNYSEFETNKLYREFDFMPRIVFSEGIQLLAQWLNEERKIISKN